MELGLLSAQADTCTSKDPDFNLGTPVDHETAQENEQRETMAGLDESVADFSTGRWITSDELDRRLTARGSR